MLAYHPDGERTAHVALEIPLLAWTAQTATALNDHQAVFALGDQVLLVDVERMKLAFIARGRGPVVVRDGAPTSAPNPATTQSAVTNPMPR